MYLNFFNLKKSPFHITPDPEFLFLSPSHREASASILYGIEKRKGFIAITGEVGVGKTTILRSYLETNHSEKLKIVYIFNAALTFAQLLKQILLELGNQPLGDDPGELVEQLFHCLIEEYKNDRNIVLIVDEAQNMSVQTLENLRMLSNLETSQHKLLQIVLVGQPEFESKLELVELRQLRQRIAIRSRITPLSAEESLAYIQHRLMTASLFHNPVFTKGALRKIIHEAKGIPRTINILCDNALITGFGYQRNPVDSKIVKEVIKDVLGSRRRRLLRTWRTGFVTALALSTAAILLLWGGNLFREELPAALKREALQTVDKNPLPSPESASTATGTANVPEALPTGVDDQCNAPLGVNGTVLEEKQSPSPTEIVIHAKHPRNLGSSPKDRQDLVIQPEKESPEATPKTLASTQPELPSFIQPEKPPLVRVLRKGESVTKVLVDMYGKADPKLIKEFKALNLDIENIDRIRTGRTILLPQADTSFSASGER